MLHLFLLWRRFAFFGVFEGNTVRPPGLSFYFVLSAIPLPLFSPANTFCAALSSCCPVSSSIIFVEPLFFPNLCVCKCSTLLFRLRSPRTSDFSFPYAVFNDGVPASPFPPYSVLVNPLPLFPTGQEFFVTLCFFPPAQYHLIRFGSLFTRALFPSPFPLLGLF